MAVFKCKMCGGELDINEGISVVECEYCGTKQTVPTAKDENLHPLFNRANTLRIKGEFDKAEKIYEKIIGADETQSEAYWGLILCKYGIEYVEDPATFKRVSTCHRASFDSIVADDDYKTALKYADGVQRGVYESEATEIDRIQKEILALSQKEDPYDVFICYKETDETGRRTQDSVIANDIYHQLTQEGFKVFYSAITLEDKLGSAYEPCIFAALNSAKVMLAIGTKPEYFNAVWVKNEWSRYLKLMKNDRSRILIPCYRDMDAYELPEEFSHLQAQDMNKIGFINDVVRGIKKVIVKDEPAAIKTETIVTESAGGNVAPLLERAFMFLEDGDFASADEYCEKVLDIDPKCAQAYLGKLMAELKVTKKENLKNCTKTFDNFNNYQKALRFGGETLKKELECYIEFINTRNENIKKDKILAEAKAKMTGDIVENYETAIELFESIPDWKDSADRIIVCKKKISAIKEKKEAEKLEHERQVELGRKVAERLAKRNKKIAMVATPVICVIIIFSILLNNVIIPSVNYNNAVELMKKGSYNEAIAIFKNIEDYKDCKDKLSECKNSINANNYNNAVKLMNEGKYDEAILIFNELIQKNKYKDSQDKKTECIYKKAMLLINENEIKNAFDLLFRICDFPDATKFIINSSNEFKNKIATGEYHTVGLKNDGTVVVTGNNDYGQCNVSDWTDITAVAAGFCHTIGLKSDGTVIAVGSQTDGRCAVDDWTDIVAISAFNDFTVGLKNDGTVVATGNNDYGQCNVSEWSDVVAIATGAWHTVGLKADGSIITTGKNFYGECDTTNWKNIIAINAGQYLSYGINADGTAIVIGINDEEQCNISGEYAISVSGRYLHVVGLKPDGTLIASGQNLAGQCDINEWKNIIAISAGSTFTIGLKTDGKIIATGNNYHGQCNVSDWDLF